MTTLPASDGLVRRLRGTTLVSAPMFLVGVIGASVAVATALWGAWHPDDLGVAFVATLAISAAIGIAGFAACYGCFVDATSTELRDVVGWVTVRRIARSRVVEVRVLAGAWRRFELELDDGELVTIAGTSPLQFPSRLMPDARQRDLAVIAVLRGSRPDEPTG